MSRLPISGVRATGSRSHPAVRFAWIAAAVYLAAFAFGTAVTYLTATPAVCGTCHEMTAAVATWEQSPHARVGCPNCHEERRPWYLFAETLAGRGAMLRRDFEAHWLGAYAATPVASDVGTRTVPYSTCEQCHTPSRTVTMSNGMLIDHEAHARRNGSCLSCHLASAHPAPGSEGPLLLMEQCFTCHGRSSTAKAPGTCGVCHEASFDERPTSHAPATWGTAHGKVSLTDPRECSMCHDADFCRDCHGLEMPHPAGWDKGSTGHGLVAPKGRRTCEKCHTQGPDLCGMCHHTGYEPANGSWIAQHPAIVAQRGAAFCLKCHVPTYCVTCHLRPGRVTTGSGTK